MKTTNIWMFDVYHTEMQKVQASRYLDTELSELRAANN